MKRRGINYPMYVSKGIIHFLVVIFITLIYTDSVFATPSYHSYASGVQRGTIRYVSQSTSTASSNGWGAYAAKAKGECGYASQSMAFSYLGKDVSPEYLCDGEYKTGEWSTGTNYAFNYNVSGVSVVSGSGVASGSSGVSTINRMVDSFINDSGKGIVSPVVIHYTNGSVEHAIIIIGRNSDGSYDTLDPNKGMQIVKLTLSSNAGVGGNVTYSSYGCSINRVQQLQCNEPTSHNPEGTLDLAEGGDGQVRVRGWAFDRDDLSKSIGIHVYIGGSAGTGEGHPGIVANQSRPDVNNVYPGVGNNHGFDATITTSKTGTLDVYVYAINEGGGTNVEIGHKTVTIRKSVKLDPNGGVCEASSISVDPQGTYDYMPMAYRDGYLFKGWYTEKSGGEMVRFLTPYCADMLYAIWDSTDAAVPVTTQTANDHRYELYDYHMSWSAAKAFCESRGGHLVTITSAAEQSTVMQLLNSGQYGVYHIGCTDENIEGSWEWVTGEEFNYENWDRDNPEGAQGTDQNCGLIVREDFGQNKQAGEWCDNPDFDRGAFYGNSNSGFICEYDTICEHEYTYSVTQNPVEEYEGELTGICIKCGIKRYIAIPALNTSDYSYQLIQEATCLEEGVAEYKWKEQSYGTFAFIDVLPKTEHDYEAETYPKDVEDYLYTQYTCRVCGASYLEYADTAYTEWSDSVPEGVDENLVESRTEYRYADLEKKTSYDASMSGWTQTGSEWEKSGGGTIDYVASWPSGFSTSHGLYSSYHKSPKSAGESSTEKTVINSTSTVGYLYYHWCRGTYTDGPINRTTKPSKQGEYTSFHAFYSTTAPETYAEPSDHDGSRNNPNASVCKDTYWYYNTPVTRQTYTTYRKLYSYERWKDWSAWSPVEVTASDTRKVETKTTYRYVEHPATELKITSQPQDVTGIVGESTTLKVTSEGDGLTYQWYERASENEEWKAAASTDAEITLTLTMEMNGRQLYAEVTDQYGKTVASEIAVLTVRSALKITSQPQNVSGTVGESTTLKVTAEGDGLMYQWYERASENEEWKAAASTDAEITLTLTMEMNGRQLYAEVTDQYGKTAASEIAVLTVRSSLKITSQPKDVTGTVGEKVTLKVTAEGDELTYQWYVRASADADWKVSKCKTAENATTLTASANGRQLYVIVTDKYGSAVQSNTVTLTVIPALKITEQPQDVTGAVGEKVSLKVTAEGEGLTYQWYVRASESAAWKKSSRTTATNSATLTAEADGRQLYVEVKDKYGNSVKSNVVTLHVTVSTLKITTQPKDVSGKTGDKVTLKVAAEGEGLTYQWYVRASEGAAWKKSSRTTATNSTTLTAEADGRQLYVEVTDKYGNSVKSNVVTLHVSSAELKITGQPEDMTGKIGEKITLTVTAQGDGLSYQWYVRDSEYDNWRKSSCVKAANSTKLTAAADGRQLYVVVTDSSGDSVRSRVATLHVNG